MALKGAEPWRPDRFAARRPYLEARGHLLRALRGFFEARGFAEVDTPALQVSPGLEPHLVAFETTLRRPGEAPVPRYLHTSPEFAMKKLLVAGVPRLFQIAHVFRDEEGGRLHHPEFTMLEWYRAGASYRDIMADCEALLRATAHALGVRTLGWDGRQADPAGDWEYLSVADAFRRYCGIELLATAPDPEHPELGRLADAAGSLGIAPHEGDAWEDLFFRILLERIEPRLGLGVPTVLFDYPVSLAALARPKPEDPRVAERFELYACGVELANAFGELTDPAVQRRRFAADQAKKRAVYGRQYPVDPEFIAALELGMPESGGIALGVDRLLMLLTGATSINQVLWLPVD
jgi:elongation factor P--(R)-beta-lysine ligase